MSNHLGDHSNPDCLCKLSSKIFGNSYLKIIIMLLASDNHLDEGLRRMKQFFLQICNTFSPKLSFYHSGSNTLSSICGLRFHFHLASCRKKSGIWRKVPHCRCWGWDKKLSGWPRTDQYMVVYWQCCLCRKFTWTTNNYIHIKTHCYKKKPFLHKSSVWCTFWSEALVLQFAEMAVKLNSKLLNKILSYGPCIWYDICLKCSKYMFTLWLITRFS